MDVPFSTSRRKPISRRCPSQFASAHLLQRLPRPFSQPVSVRYHHRRSLPVVLQNGGDEEAPLYVAPFEQCVLDTPSQHLLDHFLRVGLLDQYHPPVIFGLVTPVSIYAGLNKSAEELGCDELG